MKYQVSSLLLGSEKEGDITCFIFLCYFFVFILVFFVYLKFGFTHGGFMKPIYQSLFCVALFYGASPVKAEDSTLLNCPADLDSKCQIEERIFDYFSVHNDFSSLEHRFLLEHNGMTEEMTLGEFLSGDKLLLSYTLVGGLSHSDQNSQSIQKGIAPDIGVMGAPLRCEDDPDFSCDDWERNIAVKALMYRLNTMEPISFTVTQQYIDSQKDAMSLAADIILYLPAAKLAKYITKLGTEEAYKQVLDATVTITLAYFLGKKAEGLIELLPGDVLTFDGKGNITKTRPGGAGSSGGGSGSGGSGGTSGSISIPGGSGGGTVIIACTGNSERMVCKPIIV
jgi:hypothetical protein